MESSVNPTARDGQNEATTLPREESLGIGTSRAIEGPSERESLSESSTPGDTGSK